MKKKVLLSMLLFLYICSANSQILNPAEKFYGVANSTSDVTFNWIDNSINETGWIIEMERQDWWSFVDKWEKICDLPTNTNTVKVNQLIVNYPNVRFRIYSFSKKKNVFGIVVTKKSDFSYAPVQLLRPKFELTGLKFVPTNFTTIAANKDITIECSVKNSGTFAANTSILKYYINDLEVGSFDFGQINTNQAVLTTKNVTIPQLESGLYILKIVAYDGYRNYEISTQIFLDTWLKPDLGISNIYCSDGYMGDIAYIYYDITNFGFSEANDVEVNFYVSYDGLLSDNDIPIYPRSGDMKLLNLSYGSTSCMFDFIMPYDKYAGSRKVIGIVDKGNKIPEENEKNNSSVSNSFNVYKPYGYSMIASKFESNDNNAVNFELPLQQDYIQTFLNSKKDDFYQVDIFAIDGKHIVSYKISNNSLNPLTLKKGLYLLRFLGREKTEVLKIQIGN